jgi:hypothetical protein
MNIRIDIECTPDEFKELFIPSESRLNSPPTFRRR